MQSVSIPAAPEDIMLRLERLASTGRITPDDVEFVRVRFSRDSAQHWRDLLAEIEREPRPFSE